MSWPHGTVQGTTTTNASTWNDGVCPTCGAQYLGTHTCSQADLIHAINRLLALLAHTPVRSINQMSLCPCRVENGGSGVCGCILGGPKVTS